MIWARMGDLDTTAARLSRGACRAATGRGASASTLYGSTLMPGNSLRAGVIFLSAMAVILLSTACGSRQPTDVSTPTAAQRSPTPTSEPTATATPVREDAYEPNDSMIQAFGPIVPGQEYEAYIDDKQDVDFFYFEIDVPHMVDIVLTDIPEGTDYDLYLVTGEEDVLSSSSNSQEVEEHIQYTTSSVGVFYLVILPFHNFSDTAPYTLRLELSPAPTPSGTDAYEPNDTFAQAVGPLVFGQAYRAHIWDAGDTDNYLLQLDHSASVIVELMDIPAVADYDLFLYGEAGELLASSELRVAREHIERYLAPGIYYITVRSFTGFSRDEPYALQVELVGE